MVVPTAGNVTAPLLACGATEWWAFGDTEWWAFGDAVDDPPVLLAVACAVAVDAGGPDDPLLAGAEPDPGAAAEVELDDPPHAASSRTNEAIPVAAAHPLLRITSLQFTGMTRSPDKPGQGLP